MISKKSKTYVFETTNNKGIKNRVRSFQFLKIKDEENSFEFSLNMKFLAIVDLVKEISKKENVEFFLTGRQQILNIVFGGYGKETSYTVLYTQLINDFYLKKDNDLKRVSLSVLGEELMEEIKNDVFLNGILNEFNSKHEEKIKELILKYKVNEYIKRKQEIEKQNKREEREINKIKKEMDLKQNLNKKNSDFNKLQKSYNTELSL